MRGRGRGGRGRGKSKTKANTRKMSTPKRNFSRNKSFAPLDGDQGNVSSIDLDNETQNNTSTDLFCVPNCKHDRQQGTEEMLCCGLCMQWFHPQCCGDPEERAQQFGAYACRECRQLPKIVRSLKEELSLLREKPSTAPVLY